MAAAAMTPRISGWNARRGSVRRRRNAGWAPELQVRIRPRAGGKGIRTRGPLSVDTPSGSSALREGRRPAFEPRRNLVTRPQPVVEPPSLAAVLRGDAA